MSMTLSEIIERVTLLGQLQVQIHEDLLALTEAVVILNDRLTNLEQFRMMHLTRIEMLEARAAHDRGIGRSP
jgi:hypothetical protein